MNLWTATHDINLFPPPPPLRPLLPSLPPLKYCGVYCNLAKLFYPTHKGGRLHYVSRIMTRVICQVPGCRHTRAHISETFSAPVCSATTCAIAVDQGQTCHCWSTYYHTRTHTQKTVNKEASTWLNDLLQDTILSTSSALGPPEQKTDHSKTVHGTVQHLSVRCPKQRRSLQPPITELHAMKAMYNLARLQIWHSLCI